MPFKYDALPKDRSSIRLLTLLPGSGFTDHPECLLTTHAWDSRTGLIQHGRVVGVEDVTQTLNESHYSASVKEEIRLRRCRQKCSFLGNPLSRRLIYIYSSRASR